MPFPTRGLHAPLCQPPQTPLAHAGCSLPTRCLHAPLRHLRQPTYPPQTPLAHAGCRPAACTRRFVTCVNPPHALPRHASMSLPTRGLHAPLRQPPQRRSLTQAGRKPFPLTTRGLHAPPCQLRHATFANRRKRRSLCQGFSSSQTDVMATRFAVQNKPLKTARAAWTLARSDGWRKRMSTRGSLSTSAPK